jgi:hypothetical protein
MDNSMHYNVIFDITQTKFHQWSDLVGGFVFIAFAIGMFWYHQRSIKHVGWRPFAYLVFLALFLCVWSLLPFFMFFHSYRNYLDIKTALQQSQCEVIEGTVTQFSHFSYGKRPNCYCEVFTVNGKQFRYVDGSAQNGFHQTGIIREGMQVRIYYYDKNDNIDKDIARLEIAQ